MGIQNQKWIGISMDSIYESVDEGKSWIPVEKLPFAEQENVIELRTQKIVVGAERSIVLAKMRFFGSITINNNFALYENGKFEAIPDLEGMYIRDIVEQPSHYVAYGYKNESGSEFKTVDGYILYSQDLLNWEIIYKWDGVIINNIFFKSEQELIVSNSFGEILSLNLNDKSDKKVSYLLTRKDSLDLYPDGLYSDVFYFTNTQKGFAYTYGDGSHSEGYYKTKDRGKTWAFISEEELPFKKYYKFGDMELASDFRLLYRLNGEEKEAILSIADFCSEDAIILDFTIDQDQNIMVQVVDYRSEYRYRILFRARGKENWIKIY